MEYIFNSRKSSTIFYEESLEVSTVSESIIFSDYSRKYGEDSFEDEYKLTVKFDQLEKLKSTLESVVKPVATEDLTEEQKKFIDELNVESIKNLMPYLFAYYTQGRTALGLNYYCKRDGIKTEEWKWLDYDD